jgi:pimeloyl-ACP methyl ester carboxylesterase
MRRVVGNCKKSKGWNRAMTARAFLVAAIATTTICASVPAQTQSFTFPGAFRTRDIPANGTTIHVRIGGSGPAVVLLHGYGDTGDMWAPLAAELMHQHTVIAPDLRGMGLSAVTTEGFTKRNQAEDVALVLDALDVRLADVIGHDIGNMVAFAFAEAHPDRTTRLVMMDAPVPGVGPWDEILKSPAVSAFTSIAFGTILRRIARISRRRPGSTTRRSTRGPAACMRDFCNSRLSIKTGPTIARSYRTGG